MNKVFSWIRKNRRTIGYVVGGVNILQAINLAVTAQYMWAVAMFCVGLFLVFDAWENN